MSFAFVIPVSTSKLHDWLYLPEEMNEPSLLDKIKQLNGSPNLLYLPDEAKEPGIIDKMKTFYENANWTLEQVDKAIRWITHFDEHLWNGTTQLLTWTYEFLSKYVLMTPASLFSDEWFMKASLIFGVSGVLLTILLAVIEGMKSTWNSGIDGLGIKSKTTNINKILRKLPLVFAVSGFSPIIFEKFFTFLNKLSSKIVHAGKVFVNPEQFHDHLMNIHTGTFDTVALFGLDAAIIAFLIPLVLQTARRWFDTLALATITPLAVSCWLFDEHQHYFDKWWSSLKKLSFMQLCFAVFITIIGMIAVGIQDSTTSTESLFIKILVIVGGLHCMVNPPSIVKGYMDHGDDVLDMVKDIKNIITFKKLKDTVGFNPKKDERSILRKHREARVKREKLRRKLAGKLFKK